MRSIDPKTRKRLADLVGMLGTDSDGERANAANFLARKMAQEGLSFGDLTAIIRGEISGAAPERVVFRDVYRDRDPDQFHDRENPAGEIARTVLKHASATMVLQGQFLSYMEWRFVRDMVRQCEMSGGRYRLSQSQTEWLTKLAAQYSTPRAPKMRPGKRGPVPKDMLDEMGLTDAPPRAKPNPKPGRKPREPDDEIPF